MINLILLVVSFLTLYGYQALLYDVFQLFFDREDAWSYSVYFFFATLVVLISLGVHT